MTIRSITLTGVEETTELNRLAAITKAAKGISVEWGVLYSPDRAGKGGRYPSAAWIRDFSRFAFENKLSTALHVCGRGVDEMLLDLKRAGALASGFRRVQLNFNQSERKFDVQYIDQLIRGLGRPVITQHNEANEHLSRLITIPYHQLLVDPSLGRGISPTSWPAPIALKPTGYAGGLGPDNLAATLLQLEEVAGIEGFKFWVDMESKLFTSTNTFDLARCEAAIEVMQAHAAVRAIDAEARYEQLSP